MEQAPDSDKEVAMRDLFASLAAVAQAGQEHAHPEMPVIQLPEDTLERAREIYQDPTQAEQ